MQYELKLIQNLNSTNELIITQTLATLDILIIQLKKYAMTNNLNNYSQTKPKLKQNFE